MKTYAFRLSPNQDLRLELDKFVESKKIKAAVILTCVGNLKKVILRMAGGKDIKTLTGSFEVVSLVGTLEKGNSHLHISIADNKGKVIGGHLRQGSLVGVTAEVVIGELDRTIFSRKFDNKTGYDELVVKKL